MAKKGTSEYKWFDYNHRKLNSKGKEYRHEVFHLTKDLVEINQKIRKILAICIDFISVLGLPSKGYQYKFHDGFRNIESLRYHMENFIFRIQAYRDKLSLFVNFAIKVGYKEDERQLLSNLIEHHIVKLAHIDTELIKLKEDPFKKLMAKRKAMSHKAYYDTGLYNPFFMPSDESLSPKKIGVKKASIEWRKNIKKEPELINEALVKIFDMNEKIIIKVDKYLSD